MEVEMVETLVDLAGEALEADLDQARAVPVPDTNHEFTNHTSNIISSIFTSNTQLHVNLTHQILTLLHHLYCMFQI